MSGTLYDEDIFAWSEQQASVLRRMAEVPVPFPNELDLEHVAEEIEDVGATERNASESFIRLILVHLLKLVASPSSASARHWRSETVNFHVELIPRLTPSMHSRIDLDRVWKRAKQQARASLDENEGANEPIWILDRCPIGFAMLTDEEFDIDAALSRLVAET